LAKSACSDESGFSLVEVLVALAIFLTGTVALAQLFVASTAANRSARVSTYATVLAEQKMEQLRSLAWGFDLLGLPLSDTGLSPSPAGSLTTNTAGFVDYLDQNGGLVGSGATPPSGTVYIRRWSIEPLPTNPNNTLILQVLVTRQSNRGTADQGSVARLPEEARLVAVKTRKSV
jgi:prepilin-type N-terminal cleavage/methylation domain-containing protein